jgi:hypothetical protein
LLFKSAAPYDKAIAKTRSARAFYHPKKLPSFVHLLAIRMLILQNIGFYSRHFMASVEAPVTGMIKSTPSLSESALPLPLKIPVSTQVSFRILLIHHQ